MEIILLIAAIAIPLALNIKASRLVCRDDFSSPSQKCAQLLLVWLVPLLGAIVVLGIHRREEKSPGAYPPEKDLGDDYGTSGSGVRIVKEMIDGD